MFVKEIWRYPVKSMGGELLQSVQLTRSGIEGDRVVQVYTRDGKLATARTWPDLLGFHARMDEAGQPLIDGKPWTDPAILEQVRSLVGPESRLVYDSGLDRFDVLPLLVATDGAIAAFGRDRRRLRPNIVIGGVEGLAEREWEGRRLYIGDALIDIDSLRERCNITMVDPDTLDYDPSVLRDIIKRFGGRLALNCEVLKSGEIFVGQEARVTD
jgi:uncharacterized protein YcbX